MADRIHRVVIIDDDEVSVNMLQFELKHYEELHVEGVAKNGISGIRLIEKIHPDLLFLDVELPDMQGMELLNKIKIQQRVGMRVIFYTAYNKYLMEALRNYAFDFLLKPIESSELKTIMDRLKLNDDYQAQIRFTQVTEDDKAGKKFMIVTPIGDLCFLQASEIGYFRYVSSRKIWEAALTNGKFLPLRRNITAEQLCMFDPQFLQVHQSFIVNQNFLMMVQDGYCVLYPPFNKDVSILVSKKYKKEMMEHFFSL